MEECSLYFLNVFHTKKGYFKNYSLNGSLKNQKWFFYGIAAKTKQKDNVVAICFLEFQSTLRVF